MDFGSLTHTNDPELLRKLYFDAAIRADERRIMCEEKDETIKRLTRRVHAFRQAVWEHLIRPGDDGCTASGYGPDDIPDELLYGAIVDSSLPTLEEAQAAYREDGS